DPGLPAPLRIWALTAANCTVGLPPTPAGTYVGASTAVVPAPHDGAEPVPPDTTACPAVAGTHSHPGVTAPQAPPASTPRYTTAASTAAAQRDNRIAPIPTPLSAPRAPEHATGNEP